MTTKRAYKLQEFVAHSASVNCLKIGRKSSRVLVTGGEDHKVNLWAIGKPNAILSLSGHSSGIDSVSFDSSEVLVAAGAASGTIKLWDLEEAKIVRTLTGHRSNCISVDFHPFGEFFASGSLDTNLKIWDIRKKGCIHTYKGHTRGVNAIRFTPDGRWVVSGGEDNSVKLWDLTAGKLLHDFKCHEGQIQCIDFHPHEFLLATGSSDRTVKFWDLETFELIGSAGPETSGVRCLTFNPDGRTLLCGLHENLKVFSWEPVKCHDAVDVGWSKLSDLNVHEGKLLGCSFNQSCVGVWVVDISRIEPYAVGSKRLNAQSESKSASSGSLSVLNENTVKPSSGRLSVSENTTKPTLGRLSVSQNSDLLVKETKSVARLSVSQNTDPVKESKSLGSTGSVPGTPQRVSIHASQRAAQANSGTVPSVAAAPKRTSTKSQSLINFPTYNRADVVPVIVPRTDSKPEIASDSRKETSLASRTMPFSLQSKSMELRKLSNGSDDSEQPTVSGQSETAGSNCNGPGSFSTRKTLAPMKGQQDQGLPERSANDNWPPVIIKTNASTMIEPPVGLRNESFESRGPKVTREPIATEGQRGGRMRSLAINWEKRDRLDPDGPTSNISARAGSAVNMLPFSTRGRLPSVEKETPASDEDAVADVMEQHDQFVSSMYARLAKLQVIRGSWDRRDIKGAIGIMEKMSDRHVLADVVTILTEKIDMVTLDVFTCLLPLLAGLLESDMDRHLCISLEILLKLVRVFGSMIYSAVSAQTPVGVDIEAEQRLERYSLCHTELEKVKRCLPSLTRGGSVAKSAHELSLAFQAVS
ncbi:katanin p80 WD40 repeat-containing subunit B1 homolog isoform X2 [Punica granatum]|uniref:Katanin p80 WD40 repeat-containing subunit B1 homolog n=1 Tax=Punica granatum TaxID=22663 RepID=A0A6P8CMZ7_PUNGR|nr:katanin p80 WD40 repeat-containing subunit B1 homolog isoform X2 [Punica granatum]